MHQRMNDRSDSVIQNFKNQTISTFTLFVFSESYEVNSTEIPNLESGIHEKYSVLFWPFEYGC